MKQVALLIGLNEEGKVLIHHKTADAPANANLWALLGGSIEQNESPKDAMRREIKEELNIDIDPIFFKTYVHEEKWGTTERNIFYANIHRSLDELKSFQQEGDDLGFFSQEEMRSMKLNENHLKIINEFLLSAVLNKNN